MFIIFAYNCYYPSGGVGDIQSTHDDEDEAREAFHKLDDPPVGERRWDYVEVYCTDQKRVVMGGPTY